jgi:hypothetical protein
MRKAVGYRMKLPAALGGMNVGEFLPYQAFSRFTPKVFHFPQFGQRPDQSVVRRLQLEHT